MCLLHLYYLFYMFYIMRIHEKCVIFLKQQRSNSVNVIISQYVQIQNKILQSIFSFDLLLKYYNKYVFYSAPTSPSEKQPRLVVLLDNNYGLPTYNENSAYVSTVCKLNTSVNKISDNMKSTALSSPVTDSIQVAVNGANVPQVVYLRKGENLNSE